MSVDVALHMPFHAVTAAEMTPAGFYEGMFQFVTSRDSIHGMRPYLGGHFTVRYDSVLRVTDSLTHAWLRALDGTAIAPRSRFYMAALHIQVDQDAEAERDIALWLASPEVTIQDTVRAWFYAINLFTGRDGFPGKMPSPTPAQVRIARTYLTRLEALPFTATHQTLFAARMNMMEAYIAHGPVDSAIPAGLRAYDLLSRLPTWEERALAASSGHIINLARAMAALPDGAQRINALVTRLKQELVVPPALLAKDPTLQQRARGFQARMSDNEERFRYFGRPMPPLVATHWFNQPTPATPTSDAPNARALRVDDGIIRIIGFGYFGCPACMIAMGRVQHDQTLLPKGVQVLYYDYALGSWGGELVEPDVEAEHLRQFYLERKHYTFPIAVWAGLRDSTPAGGLLPRPSPTILALHICGGPFFLVLDGRGIVRHWQQGYQGYRGGGETSIEAIVNQLRRERDGAQDQNPGLTAPPSTPSSPPASPPSSAPSAMIAPPTAIPAVPPSSASPGLQTRESIS